MFLENCIQIHSVIFALSRQIDQKKYAKIINRLYAGNKVFVAYQTQGRLTPKPPLRTPLGRKVCKKW